MAASRRHCCGGKRGLRGLSVTPRAHAGLSREEQTHLLLPPHQVHFTIGKPCSSCERGALAARAFSPGDVIARLPASATLAVGPGTLPKEALKLLTRMHTDPKVNQTFPAFLGSLPGLGDMLAPASLAPEELSELHMPELVSGLGWFNRVPMCMLPSCACHPSNTEAAAAAAAGIPAAVAATATARRVDANPNATRACRSGWC